MTALRKALDERINMDGRGSWALQAHLGGLDAQSSFFNDYQGQSEQETG